MNQADTLEKIMGTAAAPQKNGQGTPSPRVISITSGKGGVGKTAIAANIAISLAGLGKKVLIIDADLGLANIDVVFGLNPQYNLNHFFGGEQSLEAIITDGPAGVKILPAGSGIQKFTNLDSTQKMRFMNDLEALHGDFEVVIIDTEAGISNNVTFFNTAAQDTLIVATPEPTSITDAYALMKLLSTQFQEKRFKLVVNLARDEDEALEVYQKLTMVSNRYLDISLDFVGSIPFDKRMYESIRKQKAMVELFPTSKTSAAFRALASTLTSEPRATAPKGTSQFFWKSLLNFGKGI